MVCLRRGCVTFLTMDKCSFNLSKGKSKNGEGKNYSSVSLLNTSGKLSGRILVEKIQKVTKNIIWEMFMALWKRVFYEGRICAFYWVNDKCMNMKKYIKFLDLKKICNKINRLEYILLDYETESLLLKRAIYHGIKDAWE